jgi:hypothetical protein
MFLLNNTGNRHYRPDYPGIKGVIFDLSELQIAHKKNAAWTEIEPGDLACVINGSRNIDTFYRVESRIPTDVGAGPDRLYVITGTMVGKMKDPRAMQTILKRYGVQHPYLSNGQFTIGFNVGNIGNGMDDLEVGTREGNKRLGDLEPPR